MKHRSPEKDRSRDSSELRGVVKKMTGRLTGNPKLEREGETEMSGAGTKQKSAAVRNPDPHRHG
ncbi:MAG TPA: hypothetical protein VK530_15140 [Candidatus Acidoferrum sp.]|nr:hypothetical protein [Candidatus Acidoferrum sp.]